MKWLFSYFLFLIFNYTTWCQDFVFPDDDEIPPLNGNNKQQISERLPVLIPGRCPDNMWLYPGDGDNSTWVCDCRPRYLYFPMNDSCYEAYRQGPCLPQNYLILPNDSPIPKCVKNPCVQNGMVPYNNTCYGLSETGGPCHPDGVLGVNETTFQVECIPNEISPFIIITAPKRHCPAGSRRNALGACKTII